MAPTPLEGDPVRKGGHHALLRLGDPGQVAAIERDGVAQVQQAEAVVAHVAVLRRQRVGRRRRNQELRVLPVGLSADHRPLGLEPQDVLEAVRGVGRRPHAVGVPRRVRGPVPARPGPGVRAELVGKQPVPTSVDLHVVHGQVSPGDRFRDRGHHGLRRVVEPDRAVNARVDHGLGPPASHVLGVVVGDQAAQQVVAAQPIGPGRHLRGARLRERRRLRPGSSQRTAHGYDQRDNAQQSESGADDLSRAPNDSPPVVTYVTLLASAPSRLRSARAKSCFVQP